MNNLYLFSPLHLFYIGGALVGWILIPYIGKKYLNRRQQFIGTLILIFLTFGQDLSDDLIRWYKGIWTLDKDLPLHMCGFSIFCTTFALYTKNQTAFELSYFWGLAGAIQAIMTPEFTGIVSPVLTFTFFFSHSIIILNVLWLVFVIGMRCRLGSLLNTIFITNAVVFIMSFVNKALHSNYWFICAKPDTASPFILGSWPWYLVGIEIFGILVLGLVYLPMYISLKRT